MVLDAIAAGNVWCDMKATGVDLLISAPQKGWTGPACVGIVCMSAEARKRVGAAPPSNSFCCRLDKWTTVMDKYTGGGFMYYTTLPTDALMTFRDVMLETEIYGFDRVKAEMIEMGAKIRAVLEKNGYASLAAEGFKAPGVVVSYISNEAQKGKMVGLFKEQGIQIAGGVPLKLDETFNPREVLHAWSFRTGQDGKPEDYR